MKNKQFDKLSTEEIYLLRSKRDDITKFANECKQSMLAFIRDGKTIHLLGDNYHKLETAIESITIQTTMEKRHDIDLDPFTKTYLYELIYTNMYGETYAIRISFDEDYESYILPRCISIILYLISYKNTEIFFYLLFIIRDLQEGLSTHAQFSFLQIMSNFIGKYSPDSKHLLNLKDHIYLYERSLNVWEEYISLAEGDSLKKVMQLLLHKMQYTLSFAIFEHLKDFDMRSAIANFDILSKYIPISESSTKTILTQYKNLFIVTHPHYKDIYILQKNTKIMRTDEKNKIVKEFLLLQTLCNE